MRTVPSRRCAGLKPCEALCLAPTYIGFVGAQRAHKGPAPLYSYPETDLPSGICS